MSTYPGPRAALTSSLYLTPSRLPNEAVPAGGRIEFNTGAMADWVRDPGGNVGSVDR